MMKLLRVIFLRLRGMFSTERRDRELAEELEAHLQMAIDDNIRSGMEPEEARRVALIRLGGLEQTKENYRDRRGLPWLEALAQDVRFGLRVLRKSPGFTAVAVATLALGIGANTAVFSVINAVLLRPLPFPEPDRLVTMTSSQSLPDLEDIQARSRSFEAMGGVNVRALDFTGREMPLQITAGLCNAQFFEALQVRPAAGRLIAPKEDRAGAARVVVLGHDFWAGHLGADPAAIGKSIELSGYSYTIVGILPAEFRIPGPGADVWASLSVVDPAAAPFRGVHFLETFLRLRPGVTIGQAQAELATIDKWLEEKYPAENRGRHRKLEPLHERVVAGSRGTLLILFGAVGFVLLIACANFAGLLLARASVRRREMVIRGALGAGSWRLIRQMLTESTLLALFGGAAGLGLAHVGVRALVALQPGDAARLSTAGIDGVVLAFTAAISTITGLIFGLIPAFAASREDLNRGLRETARGISGSGQDLRLRRILVTAEIALALVLLAGAGLLVKSFWKLRAVAPGFRTEEVLTMRLELPSSRYESIASQRRFRERLLESLNAAPGVGAAIVSELPMSGDSLTHNFLIDGRPAIAEGSEPELLTRTVSDGYFRLMKIPLRGGREFTPADREGTPLVTIVNESFVRAYFADRDPIGARIRWAHEETPHWMTIVGVVGDVRHFGPARPEEPAAYDLYAQTPQPWKRWMYVVVRSSIAGGALVRQVTGRIGAIDGQLPATKIRAMTEVVSDATGPQKFNLILLCVFAGVALTLAAIGIYGVISYSVMQQIHDIGIRLAVGAEPRDILRLVVGDGGRLAAAGALYGLLGALALTRLMSSLLFGVNARDPVTFACVVALLTAVAGLASYIPARSAAKMSPVTALREE